MAEKWQIERNERVIPAAEYICGINPKFQGPLFFWEGWHKGCDKSNTIARICNWLLAYSKRPLRAYAAAKDADQARVVYDAMYKIAQLNKKWLGERLEFKHNNVTGRTNGSRLQVLTSDAGGVAGITPEVLVCDELSAWEDREFWDGLFGGAMKRSGIDSNGKPKGNCLVYVITNSGFKDSWQWSLRQEASRNPLWSFYENPPCTIFPSWLSPEVIATVRRGMTEWEAKRLLDNLWISPDETGERYFTAADIDAAIGQPKEPPAGATVWLGIDYGERKDRTALAVVWMDDQGVIHVPEVTVWAGSPETPVQLEEVEQWVRLQMARYPNAIPVFDPHQTTWLIQKLEKEGKEVRKFEFRSGKGNLLMAENMRTLFKNRKIVFSLFTGLIGGSTLCDEFKEIIAQVKQYGVRMQHTRTSHDDRVCAVSMASYCAVLESEPGPVPQKGVPTGPALPTLPRQSGLDRQHAARRGLFGIGMPNS